MCNVGCWSAAGRQLREPSGSGPEVPVVPSRGQEGKQALCMMVRVFNNGRSSSARQSFL